MTDDSCKTSTPHHAPRRTEKNYGKENNKII